MLHLLTASNYRGFYFTSFNMQFVRMQVRNHQAL